MQSKTYIQTRPSSNEDVSSGKYYYRTIKK